MSTGLLAVMETPLPTAEKFKSLNVEESRAKRMERQQARLRDRGGIFRPENRNNNLFDILIQAAHRKSPEKGRGRTRSRSVSPIKKTTMPKNNRRKSSKTSSGSSLRGGKDAPNLTLGKQEDKTDQPLEGKAKGNKKQVVRLDDTEDKPAKPKSRSKKAATAQNKSTANNTRRQKSENIHDDNTLKQNTRQAPKSRVTKPKGKRKKTVIKDNRDSCEGSPLAKDKKTIMARSKSLPQVVAVEVTEVTNEPHNKPRNTASSAERDIIDTIHVNPPPKFAKPLKKANMGGGQACNSSGHDLPLRTTAQKQMKRKAESEDVGMGVDLPPAKRRVPSKSCSKAATMDEEDFLTKCKDHTLDSTGASLANAINCAANKAQPVRDNENISLNPKSIVDTALKSKDFPPTSTQDVEPGLSKVTDPIKKKRSRAQVEVDGEITDSRVETQQTKGRHKDVLQPRDASTRGEESSSKFKSNKKTKGNEEQESGCKQTKTVSRKRKENATATKRKTATARKKNVQSRDGTNIPARIRKKFNVQRDDCASDDEPDPIDFLS